jgi:S1-C subfamily serine protease
MLHNYVIAVLLISIGVIPYSGLASTICNEVLTDVENNDLKIKKLPLDAVVRIASPLQEIQVSPYYGHGSGVLVQYREEAGFVLSASHVTASQPLILVSISTQADRRLFWAQFVKEDKNIDLSLYKLIDGGVVNNTAKVFEGNNEIFEQSLFTVGYPIKLSSLSKAELFPLSKLIVRKQNLLGTSKYLGLGLKIKPLVMSDCIETGLSGGPVFDNEGRIFGINHSTDRFRNSVSTVNGYIVSSAHIVKFLK